MSSLRKKQGKSSIFCLPKVYPPPENIKEAKQIIEDLTIDIIRIESQLSNRNVRDDLGLKLAVKDFQSWHFRAVTALTIKKVERRHYQKWLIDNRTLGE